MEEGVARVIGMYAVGRWGVRLGVGWWWGGGAGGGGATTSLLHTDPLACVRSVAENVAPRGPPVSHFGYFRPSWRR